MRRNIEITVVSLIVIALGFITKLDTASKVAWCVMIRVILSIAKPTPFVPAGRRLACHMITSSVLKYSRFALGAERIIFPVY
jgi:hypothetical protein